MHRTADTVLWNYENVEVKQEYEEVKQEEDVKIEYVEVKQEEDVKIEYVEVKQEEELIIENDQRYNNPADESYVGDDVEGQDKTYCETTAPTSCLICNKIIGHQWLKEHSYIMRDTGAKPYCCKIHTDPVNNGSRSRNISINLQIEEESSSPTQSVEETKIKTGVLGDYEFVTVKQEENAKAEYKCEENYDDPVSKPRDRSANSPAKRKNKNLSQLMPKPPYYECKKCLEKFSDIKGLKKHREEFKHSPFVPTLCPVCNKMIGYSLTQHMRMHTGEKPYGCKICGASFSRNGNLIQHERSKHSDLNAKSGDFQCVECDRTFAEKRLLRRHCLIHGEKKLLCSVCGRGFATKDLLNSHSKVHTGVRPHACHVCGKAFNRFGHLKTHKLIHTGEKPNVCSICNKAFTHQTTLKSHMRIHTGEKPHSCGICGKSFIRNGALTVHKRTHTGEKPYVCPICGKEFSDSRSVKKHKRIHSEQNLILKLI